MTTNGNNSPRGSQPLVNPSTVPPTVVNRTSDLGVRHLSYINSNRDAINNESAIRGNSGNLSNTEENTFGYGKRTKVGAWNVRSLYGQGIYEQVEREMIRHNISILGLSETKWRGKAEYSATSGLTRMLYSGEEDTGSGQRLNGVGIMLNKKARKSLIAWEPVSARIMTARFNTKIRKVTIIQCYAPTNNAEEDDKTTFYAQLNSVYNNVPKGDITIIMGDLNAKVGPDNVGLERVMGRHGLGQRNNNGDMLVDFCNARQLVVGGTLFPHKTCHKVTWVSPDGQTQNQIDHFIIQQRWRKSLCDVRNERSADVGSDHHLLLATMQLRTAGIRRRSENTATRPKFNTTVLSDPNMCRNFVNTLNDKASNVDLNVNVPIETMWDTVKRIFMEAGSETVPRQSRDRDMWISQDTWDKITHRRALKISINRETDAQRKLILRNEYRSAHKVVQRCVRRDRRARLDELAESAEDAARRGNARELYNITKDLVGQQSSNNHPVLDTNGRLLVSIEDQLRRWKEHFCALLNDDQNTNAGYQLPEVRRSSRGINIDPPTSEELRTAILLLKNNKAAGLDGVPAEFLKADPNLAADILLPLFVAIWENETFPREWKDGVIVKLPKKGDLKNCNNWRGITILSVFPKLMATIVLERIKSKIESTLKRHQAGFRSGRSCVDHINTLRIILEQSSEYQSPLYLMFVDFEKAFDSVSRDAIWRSLGNRGIPDKIVAIIKESYNNARCLVLHSGQLSDAFEVRQGVRQGDVLSPILFLLAIDDVMTATVGENERLGIQWGLFQKLSHLDYADDICLMANGAGALDQMSLSLQQNGEANGLRINAKKTKIMHTSRNQQQQVIVRQETIEEVTQFNYLGSFLALDGGTDQDVSNRINKARSAFGMLSPVWNSTKISLRTKLKFFESNVKSVLLYACETWKCSTNISSRLQGFVNRCLRYILKIRWPQTISNNELWLRTGQTKVDDDIKQRKWRWIGHTLRKPDDNIAKQCFEWNPQGARRLGRPKTTWRSTVMKEARSQNLQSWAQLRYRAGYRERWKDLVVALCSRRS